VNPKAEGKTVKQGLDNQEEIAFWRRNCINAVCHWQLSKTPWSWRPPSG
jgi:hypothetical protein